MTEKLCECCGKRPVADGLRKLCWNCWKNNGEVQDGHNKQNGHATTGKS
jgi:hypothetical protein